MRVAFFSPLPPARSGIADYSEALIQSLKPLVELEVFSAASRAFDPARFDIALYHLGNNVYHDFVYETALRHPGVVAMHESNLHHLIADLTIKRGDWDAYIRECEYHGGPQASAYAERVRKLEVGPDYEGVPMTRRILEKARGLVVHSRFMREEMRAAAFTGPVAVIPHGAWIPEADRNEYRHRLGLDEITPLVGVFGFLKPYKRIAESLRAFRRLVRLVPDARMILVGEPHPEFPLEAMIGSMGLSANVRVLGFVPIEEFVGYLGACDIVLNLRYPTVGESSGTLLRSMGLGKAVMVSEVGSFQEFPDDVCLKVPVGPGEEDLIFEYLNLLVSRPDVAQALGARAKDYVARECNWAAVARRYAAFLEAVVEGREYVEEAATGVWTRLARLPARMGGQQAGPRVPGNAPDAPGQDPRYHSARRRVGPHPGDGGLHADHAGSAQQAGVRRSARVLLRRGGPRGSPRGYIRRGRAVRVRRRSFRRREAPLPVSRRAFFDGALLRADRAPGGGPDAPDVRGEPHSEARRPPGADHAERGGAAGHLGHSPGISSGLFPGLYPAAGGGRGGSAA
jgi:glycosyltransferase involved in cell wall biosynthesis